MFRCIGRIRFISLSYLRVYRNRCPSVSSLVKYTPPTSPPLPTPPERSPNLQRHPWEDEVVSFPFHLPLAMQGCASVSGCLPALNQRQGWAASRSGDSLLWYSIGSQSLRGVKCMATKTYRSSQGSRELARLVNHAHKCQSLLSISLHCIALLKTSLGSDARELYQAMTVSICRCWILFLLSSLPPLFSFSLPHCKHGSVNQPLICNFVQPQQTADVKKSEHCSKIILRSALNHKTDMSCGRVSAFAWKPFHIFKLESERL